MAGLKRSLTRVLLVGTAMAVTLVAIEGISSGLLFVSDAWRFAPAGALAEARHTEYDTLLGWINRPHMSLPDMYGPGVFLVVAGVTTSSSIHGTSSTGARSRARFSTTSSCCGCRVAGTAYCVRPPHHAGTGQAHAPA
jgi:hypothetical protein